MPEKNAYAACVPVLPDDEFAELLVAVNDCRSTATIAKCIRE